jgi:Sulfate permease family
MNWASRVIPTLTTGVLIGVVMVAFSTSFAALVFSGDLAVHLPAAIGLVLLGNAVVMVVIAAFSSLPGTIAGTHPTTAPIAAAMAVAIASDLPAAGERTFLTVVLAISLATLVAGACFFVPGSLELGNLVRFVPYPVIGGFLAGTGWLLITGAIGVLSGTRPSLDDLSVLGQSNVAPEVDRGRRVRRAAVRRGAAVPALSGAPGDGARRGRGVLPRGARHRAYGRRSGVRRVADRSVPEPGAVGALGGKGAPVGRLVGRPRRITGRRDAP